MHDSSRRQFIQTVMVVGVAGALGGIVRNSRAAEPGSTAPRAEEHAGGTAKMSLLILGGTGFLGPHLVEIALDRKHKVTIFNRGRTEKRKGGLFKDEPVERLYGNRDPNKHAEETDDTTPKGLTSLEGGKWDAVIDTSGYYPRMVKASAEMLAPNAKWYSFISSMSVYASTADRGMDETAAVGTITDTTVETMGQNFENYGPLKALCEQEAEKAFTGRCASVRPGLIIGPGDPTDRFTYWPVRVDRGGEVLAPGTPNDPIQVVDVRDLAEWLITMAERRTAGVFNAMGPKTGLTMGIMLDACKAAAPASDAKFTWASAAFLREQNVSAWGDMPVWIPPEGDTAGFHQANPDRAVAAGLRFRPIGETARDTLAWWKTQPQERQSKPTRAGIAAEREAEVLKAWHEREGK